MLFYLRLASKNRVHVCKPRDIKETECLQQFTLLTHQTPDVVGSRVSDILQGTHNLSAQTEFVTAGITGTEFLISSESHS